MHADTFEEDVDFLYPTGRERCGSDTNFSSTNMMPMSSDCLTLNQHALLSEPSNNLLSAGDSLSDDLLQDHPANAAAAAQESDKKDTQLEPEAEQEVELEMTICQMSDSSNKEDYVITEL